MKALKLFTILLLPSLVFFSCAKDEEHTNYLRIDGTEYEINTALYEIEHTGTSTSTHKVELKSSKSNPENFLSFRIISDSVSTLKNGKYYYDKPGSREAGEFGTVVVYSPDVNLGEANIDDSYTHTVEVLTNSTGGKIFDIHLQFLKDNKEYAVHARYEGEI